MQQVQRDTFQRLTPSLDTWPPITTGGGEGGGGVIPETSREGGGVEPNENDMGWGCKSSISSSRFFTSF